MKNIWILFQLASIILAGSAQANLELLVTPLGAPEVGIQPLLKHALVLNAEAVFDLNEVRGLKELGASDLIQSYRITVRGSNEAKQLVQWMKAHGLKFEIRENSSVVTLSEPLEKYQWGLSNAGKTHRLRLDDLSTIALRGMVGEDIGADSGPPESQDPLNKVMVAVLDTGIDISHSDLAAQILTKKGECDALAAQKSCYLTDVEVCKKITDPVAKKNCQLKENKPGCDAKWASVDTDQNGYPLDCQGWNLTAPINPLTQIKGNEEVTDDRGHGTHVAGVIGAKVNSLGLKGVVQNVSLLPVKIFRDRISSPVTPQSAVVGEDRSMDGDPLPLPKETGIAIQGFVDVVARGMLYAIRSGAKVINMSMAWPAAADTQLMRRMVQLAQNRGIVIVAAAGNDSTEARVLPCAYSGVICVASYGPDGALSHFSNYGAQVELAAPGLNILSTWPMTLRTFYYTEREGYDYDNGTSMSAPFVAGAVARLLGSGMNSQEAVARLYASARPIQKSNLASPLVDKKFVQLGNASLGDAFRVLPRPLMMNASKWPLQLDWDGHRSELAFRVPVKNLWVQGREIRITAKEFDSRDFRIKNEGWTFSDWKSGEIKWLEVTVLIDNPKLDQGIKIDFQVISNDGQSLGHFVVAADLTLRVTPETSGPQIEKIAIEGAALPQGRTLRSVTEMDLSTERDYLAIE
ncbi:MAG: S8 family serine peptidase, partial [Bdellovibrionota bacterium]